uniref:Uncharacterized protein n=1 Tax=Megaselia scalaris TaxID=36166 RepID=T1GZI9_MEGSC
MRYPLHQDQRCNNRAISRTSAKYLERPKSWADDCGWELIPAKLSLFSFPGNKLQFSGNRNSGSL